ncbi:fumarylacetoacetate hydrolase family protein [Aquabacterium sp. OR-4]|uniref:fumarylacetoacetate hydrolase family protein n=1 Tax=Aquabacterium sp. OR-4 TaxID=2978127 RepID=UPI0021B461F0|nr:fumarylacetoacetate hydrolase family protein [Aquabacterium sp. OR-4]MDT7837008.1 fumarylacetoacetate hydrolase family protein [Aquabacterium sp. OR-4]
MKLATLNNGRRDGRLVVVSRDLRHATDAAPVAATMQQLIEDWDARAPGLQSLYEMLNAGRGVEHFAFDPAQAMSPLPRTHQFVDASAFLNHGNIMEEAYKLDVKKTPGIPVLVQRQSDDFCGPCDDYPLHSEADNGDFEGEFAVVMADTPMASPPEACAAQIRLVMILNDVSLRAHLFRELQMGFGFINAKPATVFGPVAVTPDELGEGWGADGRIHLEMRVSRNGQWFGHPNGREMDWSFGELLARLALNRNLRAGTILGTGTVSNRAAREVGSACLAEKRALEKITTGDSSTPFLTWGDRLRFEVLGADGQSIFGAIDHRFVPFKAGA